MSFRRNHGNKISATRTAGARARAVQQSFPVFLNLSIICAFAFLLGVPRTTPASAISVVTPAGQSQDKAPDAAGSGFELKATEADVLQVVEAVAQDSIVRGTYVYEKQKTLTGAVPANSSTYFGTWPGPGHAFYKVLKGAVAPRHFRDSGDMGTITVRYVVQPQSETRVHLWIAAVFVEDASRKAAPSDGTVESSECKEIQDRLQEIQAAEQETADLLKKRQEQDERQAALLRDRQEETAKLEADEASIKSLDSRLVELRRKVVVKVANGNTELKSAPFHSATKLQSLQSGQELVVLIVTPSWLGVETFDKHRGWLRHDQVEAIP